MERRFPQSQGSSNRQSLLQTPGLDACECTARRRVSCECFDEDHTQTQLTNHSSLRLSWVSVRRMLTRTPVPIMRKPPRQAALSQQQPNFRYQRGRQLRRTEAAGFAFHGAGCWNAGDSHVSNAGGEQHQPDARVGTVCARSNALPSPGRGEWGTRNIGSCCSALPPVERWSRIHTVELAARIRSAFFVHLATRERWQVQHSNRDSSEE